MLLPPAGGRMGDRSGHNTYRLLLKKKHPRTIPDGNRVEKSTGSSGII